MKKYCVRAWRQGQDLTSLRVFYNKGSGTVAITGDEDLPLFDSPQAAALAAKNMGATTAKVYAYDPDDSLHHGVQWCRYNEEQLKDMA